MSKWNISRNHDGTVVVTVKCERCGRQESSPLLMNFQHGGPCSVRIEFPPEKAREEYAELREVGRVRVPWVPHRNFRKVLVL